jgi:hypothetical protein
MKKTFLLVTSAVCMLGAVAAQAAPYVCYERKPGSGPADEPNGYLTYQVRPEGPISSGREARNFGSPIQSVYSVFGTTRGLVEDRPSPTPAMGTVATARDKQAFMTLLTSGLSYNCKAQEDPVAGGPDDSATPPAWFCTASLITAQAPSVTAVFTKVDPSKEEGCSAYNAVDE